MQIVQRSCFACAFTQITARTRPQSYFDTRWVGVLFRWTSCTGFCCLVSRLFLVSSENRTKCSVWSPEHTVNTWQVKAFASCFTLETEFPWLGGNLHGPGVFPANTTLALLWSLSVQGAWIPNCTHPPALRFVYPVRTCTFWPYRVVLPSFPTSSRSPMHWRAVAATSNEHFCRVKFLWIRFLHYMLCGPPWHLIQAIITSEKWYKRNLPLKAFMWYLTAAYHTHRNGRV